MNSYLLESLDSLSLQKEQEKIIKKENFLEAAINNYDMEETTLTKALEDLDTYGFITNKKVIIIKNIETIKYDETKKEVDHLFKYIDNPSPDNLLIIEAKKLNNTTKIAKELKKKCTYIDIKINTKEYIKNKLKDYKISQDTITYLEEYCLKDLTKISIECDKLKNYKYDEKIITKEDINEIVVKKKGSSQDLVFSLSRNIAEKNKKESLKIYNELKEYNIEPLSILGLLASQLRIIYQVKLLTKRNIQDKEIAEMLEEKSVYRITKTKELINLYTEHEILELMKKLAEIDLKIKTSDVDSNSLIEMFIINL